MLTEVWKYVASSPTTTAYGIYLWGIAKQSKKTFDTNLDEFKSILFPNYNINSLLYRQYN